MLGLLNHADIDQFIEDTNQPNIIPLDLVLPIATLSPVPDAPPPKKPSPILDTPGNSSVTAPQQAMEVDSSGDIIVDELRAMTLAVPCDSRLLGPNESMLHDVVECLRREIEQLQAHNTATAERLDGLNEPIAVQDTEIQTLQVMHAELLGMQCEVKALQDVSATRDKNLQCAQEQLSRQEQANRVLQDAYNALHLRILAPNHASSSPFANSMYLANPASIPQQSMMPLSLSQMQAMEGLYLYLPQGQSGFGGHSAGNIGSGSGITGFGVSSSVGQSVSNVASSSRRSGDASGGSASGVGLQN